MNHRLHRICLALMLAVPGAARALGLGDIHLDSGLNQPLSAQIELVGATAEELAQIHASVANRETFLRYGVDRPAFLSSISFKVGQDAAGKPVLMVRSGESVTEPFVTFLVDVSWPRGKLTREYTLLLDPPVFDSQPKSASASAPVVQAPVGGATATPSAAPIERHRAPVAAPTGEGVAAGSTYTVVANDTLGAIARRSGATSGSELNRTMIGIFRANPSAFDGNINRLRRGATLSIPAADALASVSTAEASREVHEQMAAWRASTPAASSGASASSGATASSGGGKGARLRLVMPNDSGTAASGSADAKVKGLEAELAETKRLLDLKNAELARLQGQAGGKAAAPTAAAKPTPAVPAPAVSAPAAAAKPAPAGPANATPAVPAPSATTPGEKPAETAAPAKPKPHKATVVAAPPEPGFFDSLGGLLLPIAGAVAILVAAGSFLFLRRRRAARATDALSELDSPARMAADEPGHDAFSDPMHVESAVAAEPNAGHFDPTATMSSETAINLEHADPLAEADFHMAYGLYDQAADIVKLAMSREPERRDLKLKLLEVYFVWSNKEAFLDVARGLSRDRDHAPAGEWDKVSIMGRQIAPEDPLFAGSDSRGAGAGGVDLDLAADEHAAVPGIDLEFLPEEPHPAAAKDDVDLDLDQALGGHDSLADTGESLSLKGIDLDSTQERPGAKASLEPTAERPGLSFDHTDTIDITGLPTGRTMEAPTLQAPHLVAQDLGSETVREQVSTKDHAALAQAADQTAELSLDDLSFEIDQLNATSVSLQTMHEAAGGARAFAGGGGAQSFASEPTRIAPRPAAIEEEATRIAPRVSLEGGSSGSTRALPPSDTGDIDFDLEQLAASLDAKHGGTEKLPVANGHDAIDFDLSEASLSGHHLADATEIRTAQIDASELAMHDLEPATLSEVGTKIDLARAYMDMGDPEGARSILQEVLAEGSASQRQEAQRLIGGLPG